MAAFQIFEWSQLSAQRTKLQAATQNFSISQGCSLIAIGSVNTQQHRTRCRGGILFEFTVLNAMQIHHNKMFKGKSLKHIDFIFKRLGHDAGTPMTATPRNIASRNQKKGVSRPDNTSHHRVGAGRSREETDQSLCNSAEKSDTTRYTPSPSGWRVQMVRTQSV